VSSRFWNQGSLVAVLLLLLAGEPAFAQDAPPPPSPPSRTINITMVPPFVDALPWTDTEQGVKVLYSFALSSTKIVPAGSIVRIFYVRPVATEAPVRVMGNDEKRAQAYSRQTGLPTDGPIVYASPEVDAAIKTAHTVVWPNIASFRASLDLINLVDLRIVYTAPDAKDLSDDRLSLTDGMLLAEKEGAITVLATVKGSNSDRAGLRAGDRILALNDMPLSGTTATLAAFFSEYQKNADQKIGNQKPYRFRVLHPDAAAPVEVTIRPPPSLTGSLIDQ